MNDSVNEDLILIIDNNKDNYLMISEYVKGDYFTSYCNGSRLEDVVPLINKIKPVCILLDYLIGTKGGIEFLYNIKSDSKASLIPVIMLMGENTPDAIINCMINGADEYLVKSSIDRSRILTSTKNVTEKKALLKKVKKLESFLPICSCCQKIREPDSDSLVQESWTPVAEYIRKEAQSNFSLEICPECKNTFIE